VRAPSILKYAGSKRALVPTLLELYDRAVRRMDVRDPVVIEPFAGSAAFSLSLAESALGDDRDRPEMYAIERNPMIYSVHREIAGDYGHRSVCNSMDEWPRMWTRDHFLREREALNTALDKNLIPYAPRCVYLNRSCFNGLVRMNAKGQFNAPWGNYAIPTREALGTLKAIVRRQHIASAAIKFVHGCGLKALGGQVATSVQSRCFVYCDPPYLDTWNGYDGLPWVEADFIELLNLLRNFPFAVLSHSDSPRARELIGQTWPDATVIGHEARTSISQTVAGRGKRKDVLVLGAGFPASASAGL